jgi:hypothetical protein
VDFTDQPNGNGKVHEAAKPVVHRMDVVDDLVYVLGQRHRPDQLGLRRKEILERALGAFDLAREDRLLPDIHEDDQVRVRKRLDGAVQTSKSAIGERQQVLEPPFELDGGVGRKRRRYEGPVPGRLTLVRPGTCAAVSSVAHVVDFLERGRPPVLY